MSNSFTTTDSLSFTLTHARHLASKVATDLKRVQRFYGYPSDKDIADYEAEITELLRKGYLGTVTYGFQKDGNWIEPTLRYTARDLSSLSSTDDDPGKVRPNANVSGAAFTSYLTYSPAWEKLQSSEKDSFKKGLPFQRTGAAAPGVNGYFSSDKTYASGSKALDRSTVKSY